MAEPFLNPPAGETSLRAATPQDYVNNPEPGATGFDRAIYYINRFLGTSPGVDAAEVPRGQSMGPQYLRSIAHIFQQGREPFPMIAPGSQGNVYEVPTHITDMFNMPKGLTIKPMAGEDALREGTALQRMQNVAPGSTKPYVGTVTTAARDIPRADPQMDPIAALARKQMIPADTETGFLFTRRVPLPPRGAVSEAQLKELASNATRANLRTDVSENMSHTWPNPEGSSARAMDLGGWMPGTQDIKATYRANLADAKSAAATSEMEWARRVAEHNYRNWLNSRDAQAQIQAMRAGGKPGSMMVRDENTGYDVPMLIDDWLKLRHEWR